MKLLISHLKWHWFRSVVAITFLSVGGLLFSTAVGKPRRFASARPAAARTAIYSPDLAGFSFSAPLQLPKPIANPALFFMQDAEPEIKIDVFGNIYVGAINGVPGGTDLWKSKDKGASFVYMGQPDGAQDKCQNPTPECVAAGGADDSLDVSNGGYLYVTSLYVGNVNVSTSMDGGTGGVVPGQAWQVQPVGSQVPADDRQWIAAYGPQTLYLTMRQAPGTGRLFIFKSTDAGKTFAPTAANPLTTIVSREGNLVVDQYNGNLYTTYTTNGSPNQISLLSSTDGGNTWVTSPIYTGPSGTSLENSFPILAIDRGGNLHLAFAQSTGISPSRTSCHVYLMSTSNPATATPAWTAPVQVDNGPGNNTALMPWIVAGSPGVVDVTWLGSTVGSPDVTPDPDVNKGQWWNVFFAQVTNALGTTPTIAQTIIAGNVHNLSICSSGTGCPAPTTPTTTRKLLEYYTMAVDLEGSAYVAFPDSVNNCDPNSATAPCLTHTWVTRQTGGPSIYAPPAPPAPATFAANLNPISTGGSSAGAEPNMKADSHNCLFSAAPGAPNVWKSTDAGMSFFNLPNPVADETGLTGGDEDILPFPQVSGARPDQLYFADLGVSTVHIRKSVDGGATWFAPGTGGAAGEVSASVDRQWMAGDRNGPNQTIYLWEHEFVSQALRMNALTNDTAWSAFASGMTDPELIAPPGSTLGNTVPGPMFVDPATHQVYGFLSASTVATNAIGAPTGKLPNVWEADGPGTFTSPVPPGPFTNHPVFKGVLDSPSNPAPPPGSATVGSNTANLFNGATIDRAGNIYSTWATPNARTGLYEVWFASSVDHGHTFYGPFKINPTGTQGNMPWITAGDNGRVEIVYYGSPDTEDPTTSTHDRWNVMFAQSLNAADREPVFTISQASDHIMHLGPICNVGILCGSGTRQLLDFFQVAIGPDGLANIAYADTGAGNGASHVSYARQNSGPLALANPTFPTCLPGPPAPLSAVSRKTHGASDDFNVDLLPPAPGIEMRRNTHNDTTPASNVGHDHRVVVTFPASVTLTGVTVTTNNANDANNQPPPSATFSGNNSSVITIDLHNIPDVRRLTITLNGVSDGNGNGPGPVTLGMGVLYGDCDQSARVDSNDVTLTRQNTLQPVTQTPPTFKEDLDLSDRIDSSDVTVTRQNSLHSLP